jgi:hypothetical protein
MGAVTVETQWNAEAVQRSFNVSAASGSHDQGGVGLLIPFHDYDKKFFHTHTVSLSIKLCSEQYPCIHLVTV